MITPYLTERARIKSLPSDISVFFIPSIKGLQKMKILLKNQTGRNMEGVVYVADQKMLN
jgi:hypothetical protein